MSMLIIITKFPRYSKVNITKGGTIIFLILGASKKIAKCVNEKCFFLQPVIY